MLKDELQQALSNWPARYYIHKSFRVLGWCIDGRTDTIVTHIRGHDHELMKWLSRAAIYVESSDLWAALEWAAENAPDEVCRWDCANALSFRPGSEPA
jgi:hypothetical protein